MGRGTRRPSAGQENLDHAKKLTRGALLSRRGLVVIVVISAGCAALLGVIYALSRALGQPLTGFWWGVWVGAAVVTVPWMVAFIVTSVDGSASWRAGGEGEQLTASALKKLGPKWQVEHNVPFGHEFGTGESDVDHVAVGPYGVLVIETKATTEDLRLDTNNQLRRVREAAAQAERNSGRVKAVLRAFPGVPIVPVVVFWGRRVTVNDGPVTKVGNVRVVRGTDAKQWAPIFRDKQRIDADTQRAVLARVQEVADRRRASTS